MKRIVIMCLSLAVAGVMAMPAQATWMTVANGYSNDFAGNGYFQDNSSSISAVLSVAAYDNTGRTFSAPLGATVGSPGPASFDADYVFLYQVVNVFGGDMHLLSSVNIPLTLASHVSEIGWFNGLVFNDGADVNIGNAGLGIVAGTDNEFQQYSSDPDFAVDANAFSPEAAQVGSPITGARARFSFDSELFEEGDHSTVMFLTSNVKPSFTTSALVINDLPSDGVSLTPAPVPAGLALLLTGLPGLGFVMLRRKIVAAK